jgi:amino acid transporter
VTPDPAASSGAEPALRRVLTLWPLVLYGLGVIIGAGIYVAIGTVIARAGEAAPVAFLLAALVAALTGLCYAELSGRFPEAAGAAAYVKHGFASDRLGQIVGAAVTLAVAVSAASIARGAVQYLALLVPLPEAALAAILVIAFTAIAILGIRESVGLAAAIGVVEIAGLVAVIVAGFLAAPDFDVSGMVPTGLAGWRGAIGGAFIAFFAFTGFETLANLAEEVREPSRTVPRGIIGAIAASTVLYVTVAAATVLSDRIGRNPLLALFEGAHVSLFALVGFVAVANGVLVQIVMLGRLFYGMARNHQLPAVFAQVNAATRTPAVATIAAGAIILAASVMVPFEGLLVLANAMTLAVFTLVDLALFRVKRRDLAQATIGQTGFRAARWVPPCAAAAAAVLMLAEIFG